MAFDLDDDCILRIRKGTTGELWVEDLPLSFEGYTMRIVIKKDPYINDSQSYLNVTTTISRKAAYEGGKVVTDSYGNTVYRGYARIILPVSETDKLKVPKGEEYASYVWGILIEDGTGNLAINIIPEEFEEMPECRVYPEIAGNN